MVDDEIFVPVNFSLSVQAARPIYRTMTSKFIDCLMITLNSIDMVINEKWYMVQTLLKKTIMLFITLKSNKILYNIQRQTDSIEKNQHH